MAAAAGRDPGPSVASRDAAVAGPRGTREPVPRRRPPARVLRPRPQDFLQGDCTKAKQKLSWKPRVAFDVSASPGRSGPGRGETRWGSAPGRGARRAGEGAPAAAGAAVEGAPREGARRSRLTSARVLPAGAGEGDGGRRRGAHEYQPQRLSAQRCPRPRPGRRSLQQPGWAPAAPTRLLSRPPLTRFGNQDVLITYSLDLKLCRWTTEIVGLSGGFFLFLLKISFLNLHQHSPRAYCLQVTKAAL